MYTYSETSKKMLSCTQNPENTFWKPFKRIFSTSYTINSKMWNRIKLPLSYLQFHFYVFWSRNSDYLIWLFFNLLIIPFPSDPFHSSFIFYCFPIFISLSKFFHSSSIHQQLLNLLVKPYLYRSLLMVKIYASKY